MPASSVDCNKIVANPLYADFIELPMNVPYCCGVIEKVTVLFAELTTPSLSSVTLEVINSVLVVSAFIVTGLAVFIIFTACPNITCGPTVTVGSVVTTFLT